MKVVTNSGYKGISCILMIVMFFLILPSYNRVLPWTVYAETNPNADDPVFDYSNVKGGESEYDAFVRIGREFFNQYIDGKYTSTAAANGGEEKVFTLDSIYAFEYSLNKDVISDATVSKLTSGDTKVVDLDSFAELSNVFCAESIEKIPAKRRSTDSPESDVIDPDQPEEEREWAEYSTNAQGIITPDFDKLTLLGYDIYGSSNFFEYMFMHANIEKNALWNASINDKNKYINSDGNYVLGWVKKPDGEITIQSSYEMEYANLCQPYNITGYKFVTSDGRYYLLYDDVLLKNNTTINYAKDITIKSAWWEDNSVEDRDVTIIPDDGHGVYDDDLIDQVGMSNYSYMTTQETFMHTRLFNIAEVSLPLKRENESGIMHTLVNNQESSVTISSLDFYQLSVGIEGEDEDGWYKNHIYYSSSNPDVAYVDGQGKVYGITEGDAVITAFVKSGGRCRPVQIRVHVEDSPKVTNKVQVGFMGEDWIFLHNGSDTMIDSLPDNVDDEGAAAVCLVEQPIFCVNGSGTVDLYAEVEEDDNITFERWTQQGRNGTLPFEDYKRLADNLHAKGKKLYVMYEDSFGTEVIPPLDSFPITMREKYKKNPEDEEAACFVNKLMNAYEQYFVKYGSWYDKAGVDGLFITENLGNYDCFDAYVDGSIWSRMISRIRETYNGEIMAYLVDNGESTRSLIMNNEGLMSSVDGVMISERMDMYYYLDENSSVEECRDVLAQNYFSFLDELYEKYKKPISTEWWISASSKPMFGVPYGMTKKGYYKKYFDTGSSVDYLEQMRVWQAVMELSAIKDYTDIVFSRYAYQEWKSNNLSYGPESGYEGSGTIYKKPAARLLKAWSTQKITRKLGTQSTLNTFEISDVGGENISEKVLVMSKGNSLQIAMAPADNNYNYVTADEEIASVDETGKITGKSLGRTTVGVTADGKDGRRNITVYVVPGVSDGAVNTLVNAKAFLESLRTAGYPVDAKTLWNVYELALRINESTFNTNEIDEMVDNGLFGYTSRLEYTGFVLSLRDYLSKINISDLKVAGNRLCTAETDEQYIFDYTVKNPYDINVYTDMVWQDKGNGESGGEMRLPDGSLLFGWGLVSWENIIDAPQYLSTSDINNTDVYITNLIHTGDRFYFIYHTPKWEIRKDSITLKINNIQIEVPLEEDGGIRDKDFKNILDKKLGTDYYVNLINALKNGDNASEIQEASTEKWYKPVELNMGYPGESIFDFDCEDVIYDGVNVLQPVVTKNYSEGEVTFTYQKEGENSWESTAPMDIGTYKIRASVASNNGYRKGVYVKEVHITDGSQTSAIIVPQNVNAVRDSAYINLSWQGVESASRYKILERAYGEENWNVCGYTAGTSKQIAVKQCDSKFEYAVCAMIDGTYGEASEPSLITTAGHHIIHKEAKAATSSDDGYIEHYECDICGSVFEDEEGTVEVSWDDIKVAFEKNVNAKLYSDDLLTDEKENLGYFETIDSLNEVLGSRSGYLMVTLYNTEIDDVPGEGAPGIKGVYLRTDFTGGTITYTGSEMNLSTDLYIIDDLMVPAGGVKINGNNNKLYLGGLEGKGYSDLLSVSGGPIQGEDINIFCSGNIYFDADVSGVKLLALNEWIGEEEMSSENAWTDGNKRLNDGYLIINGRLWDIEELQAYGSCVYVKKGASLSVDSITGIYGEIYLQRDEDGTLSELSVNKTMKDMIWQIRLMTFDTLNEESVRETGSLSEVAQGTVLAHIPSSADSSCVEKLGFMVKGSSDWSNYNNKSLVDNNLYYDDGSTVIDHAWDAGEITIAATCVYAAKKTYTCTVCGETKEEDYGEIDPTNHTGGTATCTEKAVCERCGKEYGNIDPTNHVYADKWTSDENKHWKECTLNSEHDRKDETEHTWITIVDKLATVSEVGKRHEECSVCGYKQAPVDIARLTPEHVHEGSLVKDQPATCEEDGHTAYYLCSCGKYFGDETCEEEITYEDIVIRASGHTGGAATCTEKAVCERCGKEYGNIDPTNHVYADKWTSDENKHWKECTLNSEHDRKDETEHTWITIVDKLATVSEVGKRHEECSVCGYKKKSEEIPKIVDEEVQEKAEEAKAAEEQKAAEEEKAAEEQKAAEEAKAAEEKKAAEEAKTAEEQKAAEEAKAAEEQKVAEEAKAAEEQKAAEEAKTSEEQKAAEKAKAAEEQKAAEETKTAEGQKAAEGVKTAEMTPAVGTVVKDVVNMGTFTVTTAAKAATGTTAAVSGEVTYSGASYDTATVVKVPATIITSDGTTYNVTAIGEGAFKGNKKLLSVTIPNTVTTIGANAFENCIALKNVTISPSVTEIGTKAFKKCTKMTKVVIGKRVKKIGASAFNGCKKLRKITFKGNAVKKIGSNAFKGVPKTATAKVPKKKLKIYTNLLKKAQFSGKVKK